ncbi:hypothetical protein D0809_31390, partial [Flavobacterium circumlabens]
NTLGEKPLNVKNLEEPVKKSLSDQEKVEIEETAIVHAGADNKTNRNLSNEEVGITGKRNGTQAVAENTFTREKENTLHSASKNQIVSNKRNA